MRKSESKVLAMNIYAKCSKSTYMLIEQMYVDFKLIFTPSPRKFGNTELGKNPEDLG